MTTETPARTAFNPYASPKSEVADAPAVGAGSPAFFAVGRLKLAVMSLVTLNLYLLYWSYKNWKCVEEAGEKVNAPLRSLFYAFTSHSLFQRIRDHAGKVGVDKSLAAGPLAAVVFLLAILARLPDPFWLVTFLGFVPFLPVQDVVNEINRSVAPDADTNERFRGWNIVALAAGGIMLVLIMIGTLFGN